MYRFSLPSEGHAPLPVGQHAVFRLKDKNGKDVTKSYTPTSYSHSVRRSFQRSSWKRIGRRMDVSRARAMRALFPCGEQGACKPTNVPRLLFIPSHPLGEMKRVARKDDASDSYATHRTATDRERSSTSILFSDDLRCHPMWVLTPVFPTLSVCNISRIETTL